ncbi:hypothetical protein FM104_10860 [Microbacterium esteraromaticum]|uniref:Uncharacterized protein n=1 Tax=Microbacterium esteraromaticum TaxID=57043 RepID=A0A1R4K864_9MICO|nr:hypothetical protein FM104_10860 [Microbacterium esteraromaticum]
MSPSPRSYRSEAFRSICSSSHSLPDHPLEQADLVSVGVYDHRPRAGAGDRLLLGIHGRPRRFRRGDRVIDRVDLDVRTRLIEAVSARREPTARDSAPIRRFREWDAAIRDP